MNSTTIITIAIAVLAVLGLGVVLTATRRSDMSGVGVLSRETRKRDRDAKNLRATHAEMLKLKPRLPEALQLP